ncbi:MAG: hypothetical protein ACRC8S_13340 [Fimbriiglobus sp.]
MVRFCGIFVGLLLLGLLGCSKPSSIAPVVVRGKVTLQSKPLVGGMIVFSPHRDRGNSGKPFAGTIDDKGHYTISNAGQGLLKPGWYRVAIAEPPGLDLESNGYVPFPASLRRPDRSGLEREIVAGGENTLDFEIEVTR